MNTLLEWLNVRIPAGLLVAALMPFAFAELARIIAFRHTIDLHGEWMKHSQSLVASHTQALEVVAEAHAPPPNARH